MAVSMEDATAVAAGAPSMPQSSGKVDDALVQKAVDALLKWAGSQKQREKAQLLEDDQLLYMVVSVKKIPDKGRTNPCKVTLPYPLYKLDGSQEVCLIVSDREQAKAKLTKKMAKERIEKEGLKIAKVIPLSKLKTDYFGFEAKRKLCGSYDLFLVDDRILGELPKLLGKTFYKKKKHPIPVNLSRAQWTGQIMTACNSTFMYVSGGTCSVVKVARVSQPREEIVSNVKAVIEGVAQQVPRKWSNIRSLFLKTLESVSLPLFQSLPDLPLKIEASTLAAAATPQPEGKKKQRLASPKKVQRVGEGQGKKRARVEVTESSDQMDVDKEPATAAKSKKQKHKNRESKQQTAPRKEAVAIPA